MTDYPTIRALQESGELDAIAAGKDTNGAAVVPLPEAESTWAPVSLGPVLDGTLVIPEPTTLSRTDGRSLLYPGRVHAFYGEPEACKGWLALSAARDVMLAGGKVLYVDFEDSADGVVSRLLDLGLEPAVIGELFMYVRPDEPLDERGRAWLNAIGFVELAVLDGITEVLALHGLSADSNDDIAKWRAMLPRPLALKGAAVIEIDHVTKNKENRQRFAIGGQHKLAGIDGAAYGIEVIETFGRGRDGSVRVVCHKDRPGFVRSFQDEMKVVAVARLISGPNGSVTVELEPPDGEGIWRPTYLMEKVSLEIETYPGLTKREIRARITGKNDYVDAALAALVAEKFVRIEVDGRSHLHRSERAYRQVEDA